MKPCLVLLSFVLLTTAGWTQANHPTVRQAFVFYCNSDFTSCPNGFDPQLAPVQLSNNGFV